MLLKETAGNEDLNHMQSVYLQQPLRITLADVANVRDRKEGRRKICINISINVLPYYHVAPSIRKRLH
jgi:hypothetical protein